MAGSVSDEAFARALQQMGVVTFDQLEAARAAQAAGARKGAPITLGDVLVQQGSIPQVLRENLEKRLVADQQGGLRQLGPYKLLRKLGEGGMGAVYLAEDTSVGRSVAVKVLPKKYSEEREFLTRFRREAQATGKLNHVNIVLAYNVGEEAGVHYYAMEYCDGETLDAILKRDKVLSWDRAVEVVMQVARGLKHAHDHGIIHRDIKPANVFICKPLSGAGVPPVTAQNTGETPLLREGFVAKILDLGLSKTLGETEQSFYTQTGVALGTPHYISPEQAKGEKSIDGRTDIYSLGATFYHLVTGQTPFQGTTAGVIMAKHLTDELTNPQDIVPEIPDGVVQVIIRMMAKDPADRYANCTELLDDLELVIDGKMPSSQEIDVGKSSVAVVRTARARRTVGQAFQLAQPRGEAAERGQAGKLVLQRGARQPQSAADRRRGGRRLEDGAEGTGSQQQTEAARGTRNLYIGAGVAGLGLVVLLLALVMRSGPEKSETRNSKSEGNSKPETASTKTEQPGGAVQPGTVNLKPETPAKELSLDLGGGVKMEFVLVPAGEFMMGEKGVAEPVHPVKITKPFYLGKYEVTQAQYEKVMGANPSKFKGADLPVEQVSWEDAKKFCEKATAAHHRDTETQRTPRVEIRNSKLERNTGTVRLPTEAEWEYACRAGTTTEYNTGQGEAALEKAGWYSKNCASTTHPVGKKAPNAWGFYDMHGNVWEWAEDRYGDKYYASSPPADPLGPATGNERVLRGGPWDGSPSNCRSARRHWCSPGGQYVCYGFRVALDVAGGEAAIAVQPDTRNPTPETRTVDDAARWANAINLLALVDPKQDAKAGKWELKDGGLAVEPGDDSKLRLPYRPPEEYDFRIVFTRETGDECVMQCLRAGGHSFRWRMGGWRNTVFGFGIIGTQDAEANASGVKVPQCLRNGTQHTAVVRVRKDGVEGWLDGKLITKWKTDYQDMSLLPNWALGDDTVLGLACQFSRTQFHSVEVLEVTGKGTFTRPDDLAAKEAEKKRGGAAAGEDVNEPARWAKAIDLLKLFGAQQDAVRAQPTMANDEMLTGPAAPLIVQFPYSPSAEYDVRAEFTAQEMKGYLFILLSKAGRSFRWTVGRTWAGFEGFAEISIPRTQMGTTPDTRHRVLIQVRNDGARAFLDDRPAGEVLGKYDSANLDQLPDKRLLGLSTHVNRTTVHRLEVLEITGKGTFTRPDDPAAKEAEKKRSGVVVVDNPFKKARVGDWVEYVSQSIAFGRATTTQSRETVIKKTETEATVEYVTKVGGKETKQQIIIPLTQKAATTPAGVTVKELGEGTEVLTVAGRQLATTWAERETTITIQGKVVTTRDKEWHSPDVPLGGLVKQESSSAGLGTGLLELKDFAFGAGKR